VASREEAQKVAAVLGVEPLLGDTATEAALKRALPAVRFLHVASHASIHPEDPKLSALFLRPGDGEDGVFELRELTGAPRDLVVLSACDSGTGELVKGEGFLGFGRAFFQAGVKNLIVSLWQVNDASSATLMPLFWQSLRAGRCPCAALREAKLAYLREARAGRVTVGAAAERGPFRTVKRTKIRADHPFFWAGFVALGCTGEVLLRK
jgi:CHAT domain-containing protein